MSKQDLKDAATLFEEWGAGWGEYVCWDVLLGYREKPCVVLPGLTDEQFALLTRLSDEHGVWLQYIDKVWRAVPIAEWRAHTLDLRADDVTRKIEYAQTLKELKERRR